MLTGSAASRRASRIVALTSARCIPEQAAPACLPPVFLCPSLASDTGVTPVSSGSTRSAALKAGLRQPRLSSPARRQFFDSFHDVAISSLQTCSSAGGSRNLATSSRHHYASTAAARAPDQEPSQPQRSSLAEFSSQLSRSQIEELEDHDPGRPPSFPSTDDLEMKWKKKYDDRTPWRRNLDFNFNTPKPHHEPRYLSDVPAIYEDEIRQKEAWATTSSLQLSLPGNYPYKRDLFIVLDSLEDVISNTKDQDSLANLKEALSLANATFLEGHKSLNGRTPELTAASLYVVGKAAEAYVHLDSEEHLDSMLRLLRFCFECIGPLPLEAFHRICSLLGQQGRYNAVIKLYHVSLGHHSGRTDSEMLHLRLRALIALGYPSDKIERYWDQYKEIEGGEIEVPRRTLDILLRTQVRRRDFDQVNQILEAMMERGYPVDAKAWLTILRGHRAFRPKLASMMEKQPALALEPSLKVLNELLRLFADERDVRGVLFVLAIFRVPLENELAEAVSLIPTIPIRPEALPKPDAETFATCARLFGSLGRWIESLSFYRSAIRAERTVRERRPPTSSSNALPEKQPVESRDPREEHLQNAVYGVLQAFNKADMYFEALAFASAATDLPNFNNRKQKHDLSFSMVQISRLPKVPISTLHYKALLETAAGFRSVALARRTLIHMLSYGFSFNRRIRLGLSRLIFSSINNDTSHMLRTFRRLIPKVRLRGGKESPIDRNELVTNRRLHKLAELLESLGLSDKLAIEHASKPLARRARSSEAKKEKEAMRKWMMDNPLKPAPESRVTAIEEAMDLSKPLSEAGYAMRLRVYAVIRRDYDSAEILYKSMLEQGLRPNSMHISPLIEGLAAVGRLGDAQRVKENARHLFGLESTLRIHTSLIRAYARNGDEMGVRMELEQLERNGLSPDDTLLHILESARGLLNSSLMDRDVKLHDVHAVASRFGVLMQWHHCLKAQKLLRAAFDAGLVADSLLRDLTKKSFNWIEKELKQLDAGAELKSSRDELVMALRLARKNCERVHQDRRGSVLLKKVKMRKFRRGVVELILDYASGRLKEKADKLAAARKRKAAKLKGKQQSRNCHITKE